MPTHPNEFLVAEHLIHTAEALALSPVPGRKAMANRYRRIIQRQLERDRQKAAKRGELQPA